MGSYKIRRLDLPQNIIDGLEKQSLCSCKDVLSLSKVEIQTLLGLNHTDAKTLIEKVSKKCVSDPQTAYELYVAKESTLSNGFLPFSLHALDLLLQNGLPLGSITEMTGPPGVGKTQFCFLLSILATLPSALNGLEGHVIYIDTESAFSANRLKTMAENRFPTYFKNQENIAKMLQRISIYRVNSIYELKEVIQNLEKEIIRNNVKLVLLDSIASLMRKEFGVGRILERNKVLVEIAAALKDLAQTYSIAVFLTNQIALHMPHLEGQATDEDGNIISASLDQRKEDYLVPALGNTWAHCVSTRLVVSFIDSVRRQLTIVKSPIAPIASVRYILNDSGVVLTNDDIEIIDAPNINILTKYNFLTAEETGL